LPESINNAIQKNDNNIVDVTEPDVEFIESEMLKEIEIDATNNVKEDIHYEYDDDDTEPQYITNKLEVGTIFRSKDEVKKQVELFSESNFSPLVLHRNYVQKNSTRRLNYLCPYGISRKSKSTGKRQAMQKFVGCPVVINIIEQSNNIFVVKKAELEHQNHKVGEEMFAKYKRKLSKDQEDIIKAFLETDPSNSEVCLVLHDLTGKEFTTRDVRRLVKKIVENSC